MRVTSSMNIAILPFLPVGQTKKKESFWSHVCETFSYALHYLRSHKQEMRKKLLLRIFIKFTLELLALFYNSCLEYIVDTSAQRICELCFFRLHATEVIGIIEDVTEDQKKRLMLI